MAWSNGAPTLYECGAQDISGRFGVERKKEEFVLHAGDFFFFGLAKFVDPADASVC